VARGATAPCESCAPCGPLMKLVATRKVARLHNTCIYTVSWHSWCQITPLTQIMHYVIRNSCKNTDVATPLATPNAAARNALDQAGSYVICELIQSLQRCSHFNISNNFMTDFHSKMSVCRHELDPQPPDNSNPLMSI